jgi:hypothetical protein
MSRRLPSGRYREEEPPASAPMSRLLVMGFLAAAGLGLAAGVLWLLWNFFRQGA